MIHSMMAEDQECMCTWRQPRKVPCSCAHTVAARSVRTFTTTRPSCHILDTQAAAASCMICCSFCSTCASFCSPSAACCWTVCTTSGFAFSTNLGLLRRPCRPCRSFSSLACCFLSLFSSFFASNSPAAWVRHGVAQLGMSPHTEVKCTGVLHSSDVGL